MNIILHENFIKIIINLFVIILLCKEIYGFFSSYDSCYFGVSSNLSEFESGPTIYKNVGESFTVVCPLDGANFTSIKDIFKVDGISDNILYESYK
ncbi:hypothetical protein Avbf_06423, partial [Armadillidium vulgare]